MALLATALLFSPAFADEEFREAKKRFTQAFKPDRPAIEREAAVKHVSTWPTRDAAKLLLSGVAFTQNRLEALKAERQRVLAKVLGREDVTPELMRLKEEVDGELVVTEKIERGLRRMDEFEVLDYLRRVALLREKHWKARQIAARTVGLSDDEGSIPHLVKALADKDARVRAAVVLALGELEAASAVEELVEMLEDGAWVVRAATVDALGKIADKACVGPLIAQMKKEEGRLREDCVEVLERLTGQKFGDIPEAWERWWEENKAAYQGPPPPPDPKEGGRPGAEDEGYYGIPVKSRKAIFIIDISESMSYSSVDWQEKPKPGEVSRLELAKREAIRALTVFNKESRFNIVVFHDNVTTWKPKMMPGDRKTKQAAKRWIKALKPTATTNIYAALEEAFRLAGMGANDKHYDLAADTIYLMSDGAPTNVDYSDDDPLRILRAVREWNRLGRIRVHTVGLKGHDIGFMSQLALENGGTYVSR